MSRKKKQISKLNMNTYQFGRTLTISDTQFFFVLLDLVINQRDPFELKLEAYNVIMMIFTDREKNLQFENIQARSNVYF